MIVTKTPFRVTLGGGGTDLPSYYQKHGGMIFAMAIDKCMYVMLNKPTVDQWIRIHYTQSEQVEQVSKLKHELAREALRFHGIEHSIEIASLADIPAGTGVGSSSCYMVGLLNAIRAYQRKYCSLQELAEEACHIELDILKKPIGKQDQYMAAFGGLTLLEIEPSGKVVVKSINLGLGARQDFVNNTHIYYTGIRRSAEDVLIEQDSAMKQNKPLNHVADSLHNIKELGYRILEAITRENFDIWGYLLDEHWQNKKRMSSKVSFSKVDVIYDEVKQNYNVLGGKVIGAGGGGFLMLYCEKDARKLEAFMAKQGMHRLHYSISDVGTTVLTNYLA
ncbi:MAG: hypothetical protein A3E87_01970 [Gammaproteobacteria bacterium RIFCSPHIGHO2_12_FULL_35_23]|nr:MAG: hypothetical protein A3E87_01970 [Gammaproteobacteria bacterium RIFCSPHIGHO2_12_FULL_35_23]